MKTKKYNSNTDIGEDDVKNTNFEGKSNKKIDKTVNIPLLNDEEYQEGLREAFSSFQTTVNLNFPGIWPAVEAVGSVYSLLYIKDVTLPFALFLLGDPSSKKSTVLALFEGLNRVYKTDKFSPKSFVSQYGAMKKEDLLQVDLLPRIKNRLFITPELAPIFGATEDELRENMAIITRVMDGRGLLTDSGVHGQRGYSGDYNFMWAGAVVDIPYRAWKLMGNLGSRLYFFRVKGREIEEDEAINNLIGPTYLEKLEKCKEACERYFKWLVGREGPIEWNKEKDSVDVRKVIVRVARLLSRLRATVNIWEKEGIEGSEYEYATPVIENPDRAENQLYNLARGHAFFMGRRQILEDDLPLIIYVALSSASKERVKLLEILLDNNGSISSSQLEKELGCSKSTALRVMKELFIIGLVDEIEIETKTKPIKGVRLKDELKWFLSDEFKELRSLPPLQFSLYLLPHQYIFEEEFFKKIKRLLVPETPVIYYTESKKEYERWKEILEKGGKIIIKDDEIKDENLLRCDRCNSVFVNEADLKAHTCGG